MNFRARVLIVDENPEGRNALWQELAGAEIAIVGQTGPGPEAFNLARDVQPDVILVSMEEPLVRALKTIEALASGLAEIPVIAASSLANRDNMRKAMLSGAMDFLNKPLHREELRESIQNVLKQRERRRLSRQALDTGSAEQGSIITVFGPKGGIGKSTLAINLSISLAKAKQKVALIDLDTQVGAAAVMLDLMPQKSTLDLVQNLNQMDTELLKSYMTPHHSGIHLLAAPMHVSREEIAPSDLKRALDLVASSYEYVVVDTPTMLDDKLLAILQASTYILMVTSLEVACIRVVKRHMEIMRNWEFAPDKIKLVVNVANSANSLKTVDIEDAVGVPVFWKIPYDPNVGMASQMGQPLIEINPKSKATQAISEIHYALAGLKPADKSGVKLTLPFAARR